MPNKHALLSASASKRWLICTAAPRYEAQFPETVSEYAATGSLAHRVCELKLKKKLAHPAGAKTYNEQLNALKKEALYEAEMDRTGDFYVDYLYERAMSYAEPPFIEAEIEVDLADYIPEGFGTCDCIMIGGDMLEITDYKHGKGALVSAAGNSQTRLYALGALKRYEPFYGGMTRRARMTIAQPRMRPEPDSETLTVEELKAWGESIKPLAQKAYYGFGEFAPGEHCRFCRGKAQCRARADSYTALEDFKDLMLPGKEDRSSGNAGNEAERTLTHAEIGGLLTRGKTLAAWYNDLEDYALGAILNGGDIPGWKAAAGRSVRAFTDQDAAIAAVIAAGYDEALVYERSPKTLAELEKLMGKEDFAKKIGAYVSKPLGKPALVPSSDKREPYNSAAADFAGAPREAAQPQ